MTTKVTTQERVRVDSEGRIALLKSMRANASSFVVTRQPDSWLVLEPFAEVPTRELWLHHNAVAQQQIQLGLEKSGRGETLSRGDFLQYVAAEKDGKSTSLRSRRTPNVDRR